jgi:hypothetical protein
VQRDTGGYAVALAASMKHIYCGNPGETFFSTSDIGWVVGHSYIIYGPLIAGMATIMYEGTPLRPDAGIWWKICQDQEVTVMFSAPTAIRVLKKQDPAFLKKYDLSKLRALYCAGEPMDETSHKWMMDELGIQVIDHYWQTETGWAMLSLMPGVEKQEVQLGSPGFPVYGYDVRLFRDDGSECGPNEKGIVGVVPPLPPGCLSTVWGDDKRFVSTYFTLFQEPLVYSSFDWGIKDDAGYYKILGRTDDVINVAGHRLGTREIEEAVQAHPAIAEVAVVGVADQLKGQMPMAFAVVKDPASVDTPEKVAALEKAVMKLVDGSLGAIARPARVHFISGLPKTRSGKMLRRSIQALAEGRDPGDLTTIEDPSTLEQIKRGLVTRIGKLELRVPRDRSGEFSTALFERYARSEKALVAALAEMYVQGVSTRKVKAITEELCGHSFSASAISAINKSLDEALERFASRQLEEAYPYVILDARYEKVREDGVIRSMAVQIAIGINWEGQRQVLAVETANRESQSSWKVSAPRIPSFPGSLRRDQLLSLEIPGQEGLEMFDVGRGGQGAQHVAQPQIRLEAVGLDGFDQRVEECAGTRTGLSVREEPCLSPDHEGTDGVFGGVVVDRQIAALEVARQTRPLPMQVAQGTPEHRGGRHGGEHLVEPTAQFVDDGAASALA